MHKVENQFYFCTTECGVLILKCQQGSVGLYLVFWLKSIWEPQIRFHGHDHGNLARKHSMYPLQQSTSNNRYIHKPRLKYGFGNGGFKLYLVLWLFYIKQCHKTPYNAKIAQCIFRQTSVNRWKSLQNFWNSLVNKYKTKSNWKSGNFVHLHFPRKYLWLNKFGIQFSKTTEIIVFA